jgi:hypothetical protein
MGCFDWLKTNREVNGQKVAGVGMTCTFAIQLIYLVIYTYYYTANPEYCSLERSGLSG